MRAGSAVCVCVATAWCLHCILRARKAAVVAPLQYVCGPKADRMCKGVRGWVWERVRAGGRGGRESGVEQGGLHLDSATTYCIEGSSSKDDDTNSTT